MSLALILLVAITNIERAFSATNIIKNRLRNRIGDWLMNDCLVTYIEKDVFKTVECIQNVKNSRRQLNKIS